jgi:uncharacterized protein (DUF1810 family)
MADDPYNLERFRQAQAENFERALAELTDGRKQSHWMWFIFPQIEGLGFSAMAARYAISGLPEARAYLADPLLGPRLTRCVEAILSHPERSAEAILGGIDAMKLRSSLTLFAAAARDPTLFRGALNQLFDGVPDPQTLARLA